MPDLRMQPAGSAGMLTNKVAGAGRNILGERPHGIRAREGHMWFLIIGMAVFVAATLLMKSKGI
jgi:hypothetical protein